MVMCAWSSKPVSISVYCKLMEHIITSHVMNHADSQRMLYPLQHGFRCGVSCETQLIEFIDDITTNMEAGKQTDCIVMDFSKAFDKVSHSLVMHKLNHYGIGGNTNRWINAFLSSRTQSVVVEGVKSEPIDVVSGVPQGSVLGPSLFLFYINDLPVGLRSKVRLFADDTIVYLVVSSLTDALIIQEDLNMLAAWEEKWMMKFHPDKCHVLSITRKLHPVKHQYTLHGHILEAVDSAKYLGITITSDLRWKNHISQVCSKANKTLDFLKRNLNIASTTVKRNAYTSLVRPLVEFACTAWDPYHSTQSHRLEMVQRRAARYVTNRHHNRSSVSDMISHLNWKSLEERRKNARLAMLYKMTNNMVNIDTEERLIPPNRYSRNMHQRSFRVFYHRSDFRKESFFPRTIRDWNALPPAVASAESLGVFKTLLSTA